VGAVFYVGVARWARSYKLVAVWDRSYKLVAVWDRSYRIGSHMDDNLVAVGG
jgi:hypothetical protein